MSTRKDDLATQLKQLFADLEPEQRPVRKVLTLDEIRAAGFNEQHARRIQGAARSATDRAELDEFADHFAEELTKHDDITDPRELAKLHGLRW